MNVLSISLFNMDIPFDIETAGISFGITLAVGSIAIAAFECLKRYYASRPENITPISYRTVETLNEPLTSEYSTIDLNVADEPQRC